MMGASSDAYAREQEREAGPLWCCHVRASDELYAAPDYATALLWADYINLALPPRHEYDSVMGATPALWPWEPAGHAEDLPKSIAEFGTRDGSDLAVRVAELRNSAWRTTPELTREQEREALARDAALDLYEALKSLKFISIDKDNMEFRCDTTCYVLDTVRAALAKAEGRKP